MTARLSSVLIARPKDTSTVIHFGYYLITGALITLILLCNCCDFHFNWKNCFMLKKTIGVHQNIQSCHIYIHTVRITSVHVGDPPPPLVHSVFRIEHYVIISGILI